MERKALGSISPDYVQPVVVLMIKRSGLLPKHPDIPGDKTGPAEMTGEEFREIIARFNNIKMMVEVFSHGHLSWDIRPYYFDGTITKFTIHENKTRLIRPDYESVMPPLTDDIVSDLAASDVIFGFHKILVGTNGYGSVVNFPVLSGLVYLPQRGICLFGGMVDHRVILHEWFHTVEHRFNLLGQDYIFSKLDVYKDPRFPGLARKYNDPLYDYVNWQLGVNIPRIIADREPGRTPAGWKRFSFAETYPAPLSSRRIHELSRSSNPLYVPAGHWRAMYWFDSQGRGLPVIERDEGAGDVDIKADSVILEGKPMSVGKIRLIRGINPMRDSYQFLLAGGDAGIKVSTEGRPILTSNFGKDGQSHLISIDSNTREVQIDTLLGPNSSMTVRTIPNRRIMIRNAKTGQYLSSDKGRVIRSNKTGEGSIWVAEMAHQDAAYYRLRNLLTGCRMHIQDRKDWVQCSSDSKPEWWSAQWRIVKSENNTVKIENRWIGNSRVHFNNNAKYAGHGNVSEKPDTSNWILVDQ